MPSEQPFTDVEFKDTYPQHTVAEHEILMGFTNDDDANRFHEWWHERGAKMFAGWLRKQQQASRPLAL